MAPPSDYNEPTSTIDAPAGDVAENEDGSVTVTMASPPESMPDESYNLVPHFSGTEDGKKLLKKLAEKVDKEFNDDWNSCSDWRKKRKDRWRLLVGDLAQKIYPFADCANVHIPVMLERVLRVTHRLYAEMFPDRDLVFTAIPSNNLNQQRADILTLDQNWQIRKEIPDFFKQNRRGLMEFISNGDCVFYSSRDIPAKRNRHEVLNCEEVVWPYLWKTTATDMSDVPRKTRIVRKYKHELRELERRGVYANIEELLEKEKSGTFDDDEPALTVRPAVDKFEGREPPTDTNSAAPYKLLECHCWYAFPGSEEERPAVITIETRTKTVVGLYVREQEDWKDRVRHDTQMQQLGEFQAAQQQHQQMTMSRMTDEAHVQQMQMMMMPPDPMVAQRLQMPMPPTPQPPPWLKPEMTGPEEIRKVPIEYFSHGVCIENLDGSLGYGIGLLLEEFNKAANTAASQFTDSATLANVATVIKPANVKMEKGETRLTPGEVHSVRGVSTEQLQNAFKIIQFPQANPQLMEVVKLMIESADGVSSAPDVLSGEPGKANETYRGIATRVEQATKQLTVLALNYLEMLTNVLKNNARLNAVFMDDEEIKHVIDPRTLESQQIKIGRALYAEDFDIVFTADTRFGGRQQKISEADQLIGMVTSLPPPVAMSLFPPSFMYEAVVRALKARGMHDMIRYLGPRPEPPQIPAGMGPPPGGPPGMQPPGGPPPGQQGGPPNGSGPPPGPPQPQQKIQGPHAPPIPQ